MWAVCIHENSRVSKAPKKLPFYPTTTATTREERGLVSIVYKRSASVLRPALLHALTSRAVVQPGAQQSKAGAGLGWVFSPCPWAACEGSPGGECTPCAGCPGTGSRWALARRTHCPACSGRRGQGTRVDTRERAKRQGHKNKGLHWRKAVRVHGGDGPTRARTNGSYVRRHCTNGKHYL